MSAVLNCNITFIGGGNMAQALIGGLIARGMRQLVLQLLIPLKMYVNFYKKKMCM